MTAIVHSPYWWPKEESFACPRCGGTDFEERSCGRDTWDDDLTWISYICLGCELWYSGFTCVWLIDCDSWQGEEGAERWPTSEVANDGTS